MAPPALCLVCGWAEMNLFLLQSVVISARSSVMVKVRKAFMWKPAVGLGRACWALHHLVWLPTRG
jgi:hypothetical protein